jgi:hypothetical protein
MPTIYFYQFSNLSIAIDLKDFFQLFLFETAGILMALNAQAGSFVHIAANRLYLSRIVIQKVNQYD